MHTSFEPRESKSSGCIPGVGSAFCDGRNNTKGSRLDGYDYWCVYDWVGMNSEAVNASLSSWSTVVPQRTNFGTSKYASVYTLYHYLDTSFRFMPTQKSPKLESGYY